MSGHSKWHQIKHKKEATDQKRGLLFSKLVNAISVAARDNPDPQFNPRLRSLIEKAKTNNVPNENIERAVKKSSEAKNLQEITVEAYGPEKASFVIEGITDNKNRTMGEIKIILGEFDAKLADPGSVLWAFKKTDALWLPNFKQPLSEEIFKKMSDLAEALQEQNEVQKVTTNFL